MPNRPAFSSRPNAPPPHEWRLSAKTQEAEGKVYKLHGSAEIEGTTMVFRADEIEFHEETGDLRAQGNVFYQNFQKNEKIWADHLEYNTDSETGKFYKVHGETQPHIDARPGILTTNNPFYFEGEWAERIEDRYVLHDGFVTNCKLPSPWWTLRGPKFDIIPGERAIAYHSVFRVRKLPLFYTPFFYKSLEREPRKSGFLIPNLGNNSQRGLMLGVGYFWAINRSYDVTYRLQEFTSRGEGHHFDVRGKPRPGTDYDAIVYDVQDRGVPQGNGLPPVKYSGVSVYAVGKSDLGDGWNVRAQINYISSFRFRQNWTESFNEAIGSEIQSTGFLNKNWSNYTFNVVAARLQNYQTAEYATTDPVTNKITGYQTNAVTIRKFPEAQLDERERQVWQHIPIWYSFESAAGLLYRDEPLFQNGVLVDSYHTGQFMNRVNFAPHVMSAFHFAGLHLVPRFGLEETYYSQSQAFDPAHSQLLNTSVYQVIGTNLIRSSRDFSLDLIFPSLARVFSKKTFLGDKVKHVIEPRATYNYVSGVGTDFSRFIRFDESDLLANTNELELSLTNRLYAKRGDSVNEVFTWQIYQKRFFDPTFGGALVPGQRNVLLPTAELSPYSFLVEPRSSSPIVSVMRLNPYWGFNVEWRADYDHRTGSLIDSTVSVDYRWTKYFISVGHNLVHSGPAVFASDSQSRFRAPADQFRFRVGFGDPNHRGWNAGVDGVYDAYQLNTIPYTTAQVTYNTDCCGLSVQVHRINFAGRNENQFRVAFAVSNIATFGTLRRQDRLF